MINIGELLDALRLPNTSAGGVSRNLWGTLVAQYGAGALACCILTAQAETFSAARAEGVQTQANLTLEQFVMTGLIAPGHVKATTNERYLAAYFEADIDSEGIEFAIGDAQRETIEAMLGAGLIDIDKAEHLIAQFKAAQHTVEERFQA